MEEDWDLIDSSNSSHTSQHKPYVPSRPSLDFARFSTMPETYNLDDPISPLMAPQDDIDNIFCESPPPDNESLYGNDIYSEEVEEKDELSVEHSIAESVSWIDNEASHNEDDDDNNHHNNESVNAINQTNAANKHFDYFLSSFTDPAASNQETRESHADKKASWKSTTLGSSVPFITSKSVETMQNENSNVETQHNQSDKSTPPLIPPFYMGKFNTNFEFKMPKKSLEDENVTKEKLSNLESSLNHEHVNDGDFSSRPIKKAYRKLFNKSLSVHSIPSYASPPKREPILTIHQPIPCTDIPPIEKQLEEEGEEEDPFVIRRNIVDRLTFASTQDDNDDSMNEQRLASIFYDLERQYPNVTEWYQLKKLNLSRQNLAQIDDLASCFPYLEVLQISHNELRSISGLPSSLIYIYASHNRLSDVDIYHLDKLQYLDLSHNFINSFQDMSNLKSLRTLDASHNAITSCKTFQNLPGLVILSLRANCIRRLVNFESVIRNNQIESLDVSFNRIECLDSIEHLKHLRELNANHNDIKYIQLNQPMERLCKLQLSFNRLKSFDVSPFPDIRVLYLDDNQIQRIIGVACISRLDSFSLRDQGRQKVEYSLQYLRGARKLYLSGSPFQSMKQMVDFYSLEYLELCSAELEVLPPEFGKQVPNLATLNLSMNRLTDIRPLRKLKYLRKLVLIDNRLMSLNEVIAVVQYLKHLHYLDLRQNPMSANIYPPLNLTFIQSISDHERISPYVLATQDESWLLSDMEFLKDLSDHWKTRRQVYRALFIQKCSKLIELDQIKIEPQDRSEGDLVIGNFRKTQTPYPVSTTSGSLSHQS